MTRRISDKTKIARGYGTGKGADYIPWIHISELGSAGTCAAPVDWKTGRVVHLLSQGEYWAWLVLNWNDDIIEIREQFPLDLEITLKIADELNFRHPNNRNSRMTTDLLLIKKDGSCTAVSVKTGRSVLEDPRVCEKQYIEQSYWHSLGVEWFILYKEDIPPILVDNIRLATTYYSEESVFDKVSLVKHLIGTKKLVVTDMNVPLDFAEIARSDPRIEEVWKNGRPYTY